VSRKAAGPEGTIRKHFHRFPLFLLVLLIGMRVWFGYGAARTSTWEFNDISQWVDAGDRMLGGDVPYRDFFGLYGPLLYYWSVFWYWLFGAGLLAAGLNLEIISPVACLFIAYLIAHFTLEKPGSRILFLACVGLLGFDHFHWAPGLRLWLPLLGVAVAEKGVRERSTAAFAAGCLLCGLCFFVSPEAGLASMLACAVIAVAWTFTREPGRTRWLLMLAWVFAPAAAGVALFPDVVMNYFRYVRGLALTFNWYLGLPFPAFSWSLQGAAYYGPFLFLGVLACVLPAAFFLARKRSSRAELTGELALMAFCAVLLRSVLGRSDDFHLAFAVTPIIALMVRFFLQSGFFSPGAGVFLFLVVFCPVFYLARPPWESRMPVRAVNAAEFERDFPWVEGVQLRLLRSPDFARIAARTRELAPEGSRLLSIPIPIYAHLAGRLSALPFSFPEHILVLRDGPKRLIAALERERPPLVVYDPSFCYPLDQTKDLMTAGDADLFSGRFTWPAASDEVLTRDLRAYLRANYRVSQEYAGAVFLTRRDKPLPSPREETVFLITPSEETVRELTKGGKWEWALPGSRFDEIRVNMACRYLPGMAPFAKTLLRVVLFDAGGRRRMGELPIPAEYVGRDLRIPAGRNPPGRMLLRIVNPGAFNPRPSAITGMTIELVRITYPKTGDETR